MMPTSLWAMFCAYAQTIGDVEAVLAPGRAPLRFADLPNHLQSVRDALAQFAIGRGDRVAGLLPGGPETAVCFLAVAACATYVPLNPEANEVELTACLRKLSLKAIIVPKGAATVARRCAAAEGIEVIDLVNDATGVAGGFSLAGRAACREVHIPDAHSWNGPEDVALILLTSGTTRAPKAVPRRLRHLFAYASAAGTHFALGPGDRCLHVMPIFHGHGLLGSLLVPLANGCGVICMPHFDIPTFFRQMKELRPTWYTAASSIHHAILARIDEYRDIAREAKLRFIRSGSSRLNPRVMAGLEEAFSAPVLERYGLSETGTITANCLPPGLRKPGTVGKPMGTEVAIIDGNGQFLGPNQEGEIVARGPSVFDGYLDDPDADAAVFVGGWCRTGDLGRFDEDGYLTLTGRSKQLINRGGEKIGTTEIESVLARHPAVEDVCAFGIPHPSLGEEVVAAVSLSHPVSEQELRDFARRFLAGIKVPKRIFVLPGLPKSPTHKIRRDQLAAICLEMLTKSQNAARDGIAPPQSQREREIAKIWQDVLGVKAIGLDDDFFLIGGDSLRAYELISQLRKAFGITLELQHIFDEANTITGTARLIDAMRRDKTAALSSVGLTTIKAKGAWPPLYAVPARNGDPVAFLQLARLLDPRQPLVGIRARGLDGVDAPLTRMEDIATDNIARIRNMQPSGPYFLVGSCFGARVAYEMARQLEAAGERVGLLLMLEPSPPFVNSKGQRRGEALGARQGSIWRILASYVFDGMKRHWKPFVKLHGAERRTFLRHKLAILREIVRHRAVSAASKHAGSCYVPEPFHGCTKFCFSRRAVQAGSIPDNRLDWLSLAPHAATPVYVEAGGSDDLLALPHVHALAESINIWLEQAHITHEYAKGASYSVTAK